MTAEPLQINFFYPADPFRHSWKMEKAPLVPLSDDDDETTMKRMRATKTPGHVVWTPNGPKEFVAYRTKRVSDFHRHDRTRTHQRN